MSRAMSKIRSVHIRETDGVKLVLSGTVRSQKDQKHEPDEMARRGADMFPQSSKRGTSKNSCSWRVVSAGFVLTYKVLFLKAQIPYPPARRIP